MHKSGFCLHMPLAIVLDCHVLHFLGTAFSPSLAEDMLLDLHVMHLFPVVIVPFLYRMPWLHSSFDFGPVVQILICVVPCPFVFW